MQWAVKQASQWFCSPFDTFGTREETPLFDRWIPYRYSFSLFVICISISAINHNNKNRIPQQHTPNRAHPANLSTFADVSFLSLLLFLLLLRTRTRRIVKCHIIHAFWFCHADKMLWIAAFCIVAIDFCHNDDDRHDRLYIFSKAHTTMKSYYHSWAWDDRFPSEIDFFLP